MNTGKQINAMVVVLFILLISVGAYSVWDPSRADTKNERNQELTITRAATTFALNCRLCHGDRGQGGVEGGRLPAALKLADPRLQGILDGTFNQAEYDSDFKFVSNTIMCGRIGTNMPTWGQSQGGPLSDEQIRQLATLITTGSWDAAQEHADQIDWLATQDASVAMPSGTFGANDAELVVNDAVAFTPGQYIRIADERLRVLPKQLEVQRGAGGTQMVDHDRGTPIGGGPKRDIQPTLIEALKAGGSALVVGDTTGFAVGDVLQLQDERVRVTAIQTGIPSTSEFLVKDIGRNPHSFLVSGAKGIAVGDVIRIAGELMQVKEIRGDGDPGIKLDQELSSSATQISVANPTFMRERYVVRIGDELVRVGKAVDTKQTLGDTIGRAQTSFSLTGTGGIEQGMIIRIGGEQMQVTEIVSPTTVDLERGSENTQAAAHPADTAVIRIVPSTDQTTPPTEEDTQQTLLQGIDSEATSAVVTSSAHIAADGTYKLGDEIVHVTAVHPAVINVARAVGGTKRESHARRSEIDAGNLFAVERGVGDTSAAGHAAGDSLLFTQIKVDRQVQGSKLADHQKGDELYLGNSLIVARGLLGTKPADHPNDELVYNFPTAPESPAITGASGSVCGQVYIGGTTGPTPTPIAGAKAVKISETEFSVKPDPTSIAAGPVDFGVTNIGAAPHNFRIISTDLPADQLPINSAGVQVDETKVNVVGGFTAPVQAGQTSHAGAQLQPGRYVLICNVPTHYQSGMHVEFTVTP